MGRSNFGWMDWMCLGVVSAICIGGGQVMESGHGLITRSPGLNGYIQDLLWKVGMQGQHATQISKTGL